MGSRPILIVVEREGSVSLHRHIGPVVAGARQQHVPEQRLDGRLAHQAHEEELLDHRGRDDTQRRQAQQEPPETVGLVRVLIPHILLQGTLRLFLDAFHMSHI